MSAVLGIYGASGLGREVLELAKIINRKEDKWEKYIFIDDGDVPEVVSGCEVYKYGSAKEKFGNELQVAVGIGEPAIREKLFAKLKSDGIETPSLIHPDVYIPESTIVGQGVVIQFGCFISCDVTIKDYVFLQPQCNIGHDDVLDEGCMIAGFGNIGGIVTVGKWAYIGLSACVKQLVNIGEYSVVGMGSTVHKDIPEGMIAMGNPARPMAKNEEKRVFKH